MEERFEERKKDLLKAVSRLKEGLNEEPSDIIIDGILHRFEFTFELAWKTMKDKLEYMGVIEKTGSPREVIKCAFQYDLIDDGEEWLNMMLDRNTLAHLYDEESSREVYKKIKGLYMELFTELVEKL